MRPVATLLVATLFSLFSPQISAGDGWIEDLGEGLAEARRSGKHVLVDFTGSDWCPPCKALDQELLSKDSFRRTVGDDFVLVALDYPRSKPQPDDLRERNREHASTYGIRGYPTLIAMTPDGVEYGRRVGYQRGMAGQYQGWVVNLARHRAAIVEALGVLGRPAPAGGDALETWRSEQVAAAASLVEALGTDTPESAVMVLELHDPEDDSLGQARLALASWEARSTQDGEPDFAVMHERLTNLAADEPTVTRLGAYHAWLALSAAQTGRGEQATSALARARELDAPAELVGWVASVVADEG